MILVAVMLVVARRTGRRVGHGISVVTPVIAMGVLKGLGVNVNGSVFASRNTDLPIRPLSAFRPLERSTARAETRAPFQDANTIP